MDQHFGTHSYSLWHLFKDEQRKVLAQVLGSAMKEAESAFRQIYDHHFPALQVINEIGHPLPRPLASTVEFVLNTDFHMALEQDADLARMERLGAEIKRWAVKLDKRTLSFAASGRLNEIFVRIDKNPEDVEAFEQADAFIRLMRDVGIPLNAWKAQNIHFALGRGLGGQMQERLSAGDERASRWLKAYEALGASLQSGGL
ncbi:MAG TPA: hypothetical protein PLZ86_01425 [bacterium]|nr:hypothetical protein [bacterium]